MYVHVAQQLPNKPGFNMTYHEKSNADTHPQQNEVISSWVKHKSTKTAYNHAKENKEHKFL